MFCLGNAAALVLYSQSSTGFAESEALSAFCMLGPALPVLFACCLRKIDWDCSCTDSTCK